MRYHKGRIKEPIIAIQSLSFLHGAWLSLIAQAMVLRIGDFNDCIKTTNKTGMSEAEGGTNTRMTTEGRKTPKGHHPVIDGLGTCSSDPIPTMNPKNEISILPPSKVASQTPCFAGVFERYLRLFHQDDITILPKVQ